MWIHESLTQTENPRKDRGKFAKKMAPKVRFFKDTNFFPILISMTLDPNINIRVVAICQEVQIFLILWIYWYFCDLVCVKLFCISFSWTLTRPIYFKSLYILQECFLKIQNFMVLKGLCVLISDTLSKVRTFTCHDNLIFARKNYSKMYTPVYKPMYTEWFCKDEKTVIQGSLIKGGGEVLHRISTASPS